MRPDTRVLVTGGSGFIGSSVVRALAQAGRVQVVSGDLRDPATPVDGVTYACLDVTDPGGVRRAIAEHAVDTVVHLAAIVNPPASLAREQLERVDVDGTRNVLHACIEGGVGHVIVSSSGAAYGYHADNPVPLREDDALRGNEEFAYSHHKRLVEELLAETRRDHPALGQTVLRIGTVLGEHVDNQITALFERARLLRIKGSESPFVFIWDTDLVEVIVRAVHTGTTGTYNVAGDGTLTIEEIAALLGRPVLTVPERALKAVLAVGHRLRLVPYGPEQTAFLRYRPVLDNSRLKTEFGYVPTRTTRQAFEAWMAARAGR